MSQIELIKAINQQLITLTQLIVELESNVYLNSIKDELAKYTNETIEERKLRSRNKDEWVKVDYVYRGDKFPCITALYSNDCHYVRDDERQIPSNCKSVYRLRGTADIYLCDDCMGNLEWSQLYINREIVHKYQKCDSQGN